MDSYRELYYKSLNFSLNGGKKSDAGTSCFTQATGLQLPEKEGAGCDPEKIKIALLGIEPQFLRLSATILVTALTDTNFVVSSGFILILSLYKMSFFQTRPG
jgi:hypothetical protein